MRDQLLGALSAEKQLDRRKADSKRNGSSDLSSYTDVGTTLGKVGG